MIFIHSIFLIACIFLHLSYIFHKVTYNCQSIFLNISYLSLMSLAAIDYIPTSTLINAVIYSTRHYCVYAFLIIMSYHLFSFYIFVIFEQINLLMTQFAFLIKIFDFEDLHFIFVRLMLLYEILMHWN
jgi:hypothetical protein